MCEDLGRLEELLSRINSQLDGIERLLIGPRPTPTENCEEVKDNCVMDTIHKNLLKADYALCTLERIDNVFKGGNR